MRASNIISTIIIGIMGLAATAHPVLAGGVDSTSEPTPVNPISPTPVIPGSTITSGSGTLTSTAPIAAQYNQSGLQVNYSASSTLSPPSCNGSCVFAVTRASPTNTGSGTNVEVMAGITMSLGTNDGGVSELNRLNGEMHKHTTEHQVKLALSEKLAEALENGRMERATIIAMNLAPLLGYKDYRVLLKSVSNGKFIKP